MDRHPVPNHLLELRKRYRRYHEASEDRMHRCPASLAGNDALFSDIILPVNTTFEVEDIVPCIRQGDSFQSVLFMKEAIAPIGESKSDYQAVCEVSKKLGKYEEVTEGKTDAELIRAVFDGMEFNRFVSWEEFEEKGYFVIPVARTGRKTPRVYTCL